jgi:hypothetical protein
VSIWFLREVNSDLSAGDNFDKEYRRSATLSPETLVISIPAEAVETDFGYTAQTGSGQGDIDDPDWATGDITIEVDINTGNMNVDLRVRPVRVNQAGTLQEAGAWFTPQTTTGTPVTLTFGPASYSWTPGNFDDRLRIDYEWTNTKMSSQDVTIEFGTQNTELTAPFHIVAETPGVQAIQMRRRRTVNGLLTNARRPA